MVDRWLRNFIWSGDVKTRKLVTVRWSTVCSPKEAGGLGIRSLTGINKASLLKLCWELIVSDKQWANLLRARVFSNGVFITQHISSSIWAALKDFTSLVLRNCKWIIGDGCTSKFWTDTWLSKPIVDFLGIPQNLHRLLQARVKDFIHNGCLVLRDFVLHRSVELATEFRKYAIPIESCPGNLIWCPDNSGELTLKRAYSMMSSAAAAVP